MVSITHNTNFVHQHWNCYQGKEEKKAEISENANVDEIDEMIKNLKMTIDQQKEKR